MKALDGNTQIGPHNLEAAASVSKTKSASRYAPTAAEYKCQPKSMQFSFFKPKSFEPDFPIIPLYTTEEEAQTLLSQYSTVSEEDPESDRTIAQKLLVATNAETRISVGIWNGRVRFVNYRTELFNKNDKLKERKLGWFIDYYGGSDEFEEPMNTGYMIFLRNPTKKITIVFGLHMGPVRVIDQDPDHWPEA